MFNRKKENQCVDVLARPDQEKGYLREQNQKLLSLISRAVVEFIPLVDRMAVSDECLVLTWYLDKRDREAKERAERKKIEDIVLDLKNRKWEPAE